MATSKSSGKIIIGWREWCALPDLALPGILAKIDSGARTSSLHAFKIKKFTRDNSEWVSFAIHPLQRHRHPEILCRARLVDERRVTSSNGKSELRPVIATSIELGSDRFETEITLTDRDLMGCRMLVGRQALKKRFLVDSARSFTFGHADTTILYPDNK